MTFKQDREKLISAFVKGKSPDFLKAHSSLVDAYFCDSFANSTVSPKMDFDKNPIALIALGGYGREEQCIDSDIDLLFLFQNKVPAAAEKLIQEVLYPLWDQGLDLGYATRSTKECLNLAKHDIEVLLPLLDARFITGMSPVYTSLMEQLQHSVISKQSKTIVDWIAENSQMRHRRFGDSAYLLEPNLKDGQGGLRDYHAMRWVARAESNFTQFEDFVYHSYLSEDELHHLKNALAFIWYVRNHLHHLTGRRNDQLHFELQIKLANALKFKKADGQEPVERFLGKLHGQMEFIKQQHLMFFYELGYINRPKSGRKIRKRTREEGLEIEKGRMLSFTSPESIIEAPRLLLKIFEVSARLSIPLSSTAKRLVTEFEYLVDDTFRTSRPIIRSFERILLAPAPTFNVLNEMLNTGLLVRLIPEIKGIIDRIQYNEYHLYPVDKHSLRVVQTIKRFGTPELLEKEPLFAGIYEELKQPKLLLWAALLHDIGKGTSNKDHARRGAQMVLDIMSRMNFKKREKETVSFLVAEHLLLAKTATRRDINDEETAIVCARKIGSPERAKMLYLLTVADSMATGPKAWSGWTSTLLKALFLKVLNILEKGELASPKAAKLVENKKAYLIKSASSDQAREKMEELVAVMSPRYLLSIPPKAMLGHLELYNRLEDAPFVWKITRSLKSSTRKVTICAKDRPGLFSKIAGVLTLNNVDILSVQVFTWRNNTALDIFEVTPPPDLIFEDECWMRAEKNLAAALAGQLALSPAIREKAQHHRSPLAVPTTRQPQVVVDNESSSFFTIIDVFTYDFPGLLFRITDALFKCEMDIWIAKIATKVDQVVDVFYVRDYDGEKVDSPDRVAALRKAILEVLPGVTPRPNKP